MTEISGAIGLSVLKNDDKLIYLFYDDHKNDNYCSSDPKFVSNFIEKVVSKINQYNELSIFIEEMYKDSGQKLIWETEHVLNTKRFYDNYDGNIYPIDIRLDIVPFHFDKFSINHNEDISVSYYFKKLDHLMSNVNNFCKYFDINYQHNLKLESHFEMLKTEYVKIKERFINSNNNLLLKDLINKYKFEETEIYKGVRLKDDNNLMNIYYFMGHVMDFYTILSVLIKNTKINVIYVGLLHGINLEYIFKNHYNMKPIFLRGKTENTFDDPFLVSSLNSKKNCLKIK
jgi:hypothetical protein